MVAAMTAPNTADLKTDILIITPWLFPGHVFAALDCECPSETEAESMPDRVALWDFVDLTGQGVMIRWITVVSA